MPHRNPGALGRPGANGENGFDQNRQHAAKDGASGGASRLCAAPFPSDRDCVALIDGRHLERECFVRSFEQLHPGTVILSYPSAAEFVQASKTATPPRLALLNVGSRGLSDPDVNHELEVLSAAGTSCPIVVLAPSDDVDQMVAAVDAGAAGYIPTTLGMEAILDAAKLAALGGVFLSLQSLSRFRSLPGPTPLDAGVLQSLTGRQLAVADALRRGKANKTIAYELNMGESTVKVHVRNIMRKLNATNRTEAAFKLSSILPVTEADA